MSPMETKVAVVDPKSFRREDLQPAAHALGAGGLVAFPTETVYGIGAARDDGAAIERLSRLAGQDPHRPLTLHVPTVEAALALAGNVPPRALPLIRRFWPGPLTIVFPGPDGRGLGIRVPAHPVARDLLLLADGPVVAASASRAGEPPLTSGAEIRKRLDGAVDWIVDAGETPLKDASTVVRIGPAGWECLREGIISRDMLARYLTTTILFVCTGNSCRSPMAEALCRRKLSKRLGVGDDEVEAAGFRVRSAGVAATDGGSASPAAVQVMQERAIDLSKHRSQAASLELLEEATVVIPMSPSHASSLARWWPEHQEKIHVIDEAGIIDPIGGSTEMYRACADAIDRRLDGIVERLLRAESFETTRNG